MGADNVALRAQLPPHFTSFYRLFLRATSAAVLHHSRSTRALRRVWRPTFHGAAEVIHRLQSCSRESPKRKELESWLKLWNARMDSTLNLLYSSSQTRGLSHELTGNMAEIQHHYLKWAQRHFNGPWSIWKPQLDPTDPAYSPMHIIEKSRQRGERKKQRQSVFDRNAWGALGEVVRMAEGRDGVSLGRMNFIEKTV
ncbi:hypothetical protein PILCRDRAFT_70613 [Piloderma croceum F 1598]|uniref:Uncharacterized protein n=1 Tax=Piloderma croceum (strain F 1598) TaxID=765440 RepID=A0A0C3FCM7_PILCF|nr:hypothetical protein PILCRDRAFT_70613 [Piloderma croceum F 1598]